MILILLHPRSALNFRGPYLLLWVATEQNEEYQINKQAAKAVLTVTNTAGHFS